MKIPNHSAEITYCLNVHPGANLQEMETGIFQNATSVFEHFRKLTGTDGPYGLGVWFSAETATQLEADDQLERLAKGIKEAGFYILTLNGFPFGKFHGTRVKQDVYSPDWSKPERLEHTMRLARIFSKLLPEGGYGTISTVPITYRAWANDELVKVATERVGDAVIRLHRLEQETGRQIAVALEPEPDCYLDDLTSLLRYHEDYILTQLPVRIEQELSVNEDEAMWILYRHFGYCIDIIHAAVVFEDPTTVISELGKRGIPIHKVHIGSALQSKNTGSAPAALRTFSDETYLHQTRLRTSSGIEAFPDLPDALAQGDKTGDWRVHYHIPLVWDGNDQLTSTRDFVTPELFSAAIEAGVRHFEVETYTLGLFPDKTEPDEHILARELKWTLDRFAAECS